MSPLMVCVAPFAISRINSFHKQPSKKGAIWTWASASRALHETHRILVRREHSTGFFASAGHKADRQSATAEASLSQKPVSMGEVRCMDLRGADREEKFKCRTRRLAKRCSAPRIWLARCSDLRVFKACAIVSLERCLDVWMLLCSVFTLPLLPPFFAEHAGRDCGATVIGLAHSLHLAV